MEKGWKVWKESRELDGVQHSGELEEVKETGREWSEAHIGSRSAIGPPSSSHFLV